MDKKSRIKLLAIVSTLFTGFALLLICSIVLIKSNQILPRLNENINEKTEVVFNELVADYYGEIPLCSLSWIPNELEMTQSIRSAQTNSQNQTYENAYKGALLTVSVFFPDKYACSYKVSKYDRHQEIKIKGETADWFYDSDNNGYMLCWYDSNHKAAVILQGKNVTKSNVIKIAKSLVFSD